MERKWNSSDDVTRERKHERPGTYNVTLLCVRVTIFSPREKSNNPFCVCADEIHANVNNIKTINIAQECFRVRICVALNIK